MGDNFLRKRNTYFGILVHVGIALRRQNNGWFTHILRRALSHYQLWHSLGYYHVSKLRGRNSRLQGSTSSTIRPASASHFPHIFLDADCPPGHPCPDTARRADCDQYDTVKYIRCPRSHQPISRSSPSFHHVCHRGRQSGVYWTSDDEMHEGQKTSIDKRCKHLTNSFRGYMAHPLWSI